MKRAWAWLAVLPALMSSAAHAENEAQYWLTLNGEVKLDDNDAATVNIIFRSMPDELDTGQRQFRFGLVHKLENGSAFVATYAHVRNYDDAAPDLIQHRLTQAYQFPIGEFADGRFEGRVQAEEIFSEGYHEPGYRGRARIRWIKPLDAKKHVELTLSEEAFWALNTTVWGLDSGFNTNRVGANLRFQVGKHFGIAPQYIWQISNRTNRVDRNDHIFGLTLDGKF